MQYLKIKKECPEFKMWLTSCELDTKLNQKNNHLEKKREDRAPHRTHMRRHRRTFSRVLAHVTVAHQFTNVTSLAQERVKHSILRFLESHLIVTCFVVTCLVFLTF